MPADPLDRLLAPIFGHSRKPLRRERALRLDRINALLERLDHPERAFLAIQVIGTNGKGSTAAMLSSILAAARIPVGLSTKPFLVSPTEHFRINDRDITRAELLQLLRSIRPAVAAVTRQLHDRPTAFEILTAAGAVYFAKKHVQVGIFEAGLGGRTDATTALQTPMKIITSISLDHVRSLGPSISAITKNKADAIRPGDLVISTSDGTPCRIIWSVCRSRRATFIDAVKGLGLIQTTFTKTAFTWNKRQYWTTLIGPHQALNASAVLAAVSLLRDRGFPISQPSVKLGLRRVRWPGRFQIISRRPLVILDGAHNPEKIAALVKTLDALNIPKQKLAVVFACKQTKDAKSMLRRIAGRDQVLVLPKFSATERMVAPKLLLRLVRRGLTARSAKHALALAKQAVGPGGTVVCTGSLRLVGALLQQHLRSHSARS